jgi:hypothetical protein
MKKHKKIGLVSDTTPRLPSTRPDPRKTMKIVGHISKLRRTQPQTLDILPERPFE